MTYIHTTLDQVVSPALQARMVANSPVQREAGLNTGHTPFLIDVAGLVSEIEKAAQLACEWPPAWKRLGPSYWLDVFLEFFV